MHLSHSLFTPGTPWCWSARPSSTTATCSSSRSSHKRCTSWWTKRRTATTSPWTSPSPSTWSNSRGRPRARRGQRALWPAGPRGCLSNPWTSVTWRRRRAAGTWGCGTGPSTCSRGPTVWTGWRRSTAPCPSASPTSCSASLDSPATLTTRIKADLWDAASRCDGVPLGPSGKEGVGALAVRVRVGVSGLETQALWLLFMFASQDAD